MAGRIVPFFFASAAASIALFACALGNEKCSADDLPDPANTDSNCDGIDGNASTAIFVATSGNDVNPGTRDQPLRTLAAALAMAQRTPSKTQVLMGFGDYTEPKTLTLVDGVGIFGGYDPTDKWSRGTKPSTIAGANVAMLARGFKLATSLGRITVNAADGQQPSDSSTALIAVDVTTMTIDDNTVLQAGKGANGSSGADGAPGNPGQAGQVGGDGAVDNQNAPGLGGPPGQNTACPDANGGVGGKGGSDPAFTGGQGGTSAAGITGGPGGTNASCSGVDGTAGNTAANDGTAGSDGQGGAEIGAFDPQTFLYTPADGADGTDGQDGAGGGGGGGSSGQHGTLCIDGAGNGGGGGGAGGCGGGKGGAGKGGGASIAIVSIRSPLSLTSAQLITLGGGAGGSGGTGGTGGSGQSGGPANSFGSSEIGTGAKGGDGRAGGRGGAAGGGGGGPSIGIFVNGASPTIGQVAYSLGPAGLGGASSGAQGAGAPGASKNIGP